MIAYKINLFFYKKMPPIRLIIYSAMQVFSSENLRENVQLKFALS